MNSLPLYQIQELAQNFHDETKYLKRKPDDKIILPKKETVKPLGKWANTGLKCQPTIKNVTKARTLRQQEKYTS